MRKGIDHIGITAVFFCHDGKGNIFLSQRSEKCRDEHHRWDGGAGALDHGESLDDCIKREVKEEYNADVKSCTLLGHRQVFRTNLKGEKTHWIAFDYLCEIDRVEVKIMEPEKVEDYGWFAYPNLPEPMHSQFPIFLQNYDAQIKKLLS